MIGTHQFIIGVDLGQAADYTALTVLERRVESIAASVRSQPANYRIRHLARFPLHTPYPEIVRQVHALLETPESPRSTVQPLRGCPLGVDQTGVGRAVCDLFREARLPAKLCPVTITAGQSVGYEGGAYRVPKQDLVGVLQVLIQQKRLKWDTTTREGQLLYKECEHFRWTINIKTGNLSYENWRDRDHDDLLLATSIACWLAERAPVVSRVRPAITQGMPEVRPVLNRPNGFRLY
ncbi:MAG TPA: hypothetical protein VH682_30465 [Gemmataceae bacterium]|jgi:hypothetical protein